MKRTRLSRCGGKLREARLKKPLLYDMPSLAESAIHTIKMRLNRGNYDLDTVLKSMPEDGWGISAEQTDKGLTFLMKQWKSPKTGAVLKNNPFGYREQDVLSKFKEFRLVGFYDTATAQANQIGIRYFQPIYRVVAEDGSSFDYTMDYRNAPKTGVYIIG